MKTVIASSLLAATAVGSPSKLWPRQNTSTCPIGAHIISSRGSTEVQGAGQIGSLSTLIAQQIPGSDEYATVYPAILDPYQPSEEAGTQAVLAELQQYATSCPNTPIVLLGWSQGGQITLDALCGTSETNFTTTAPLAAQYGKNIKAIVVYGDPSRAVGQPYNAGNATDAQLSIFPRVDTAACAPYQNKIKSYCDIGDPFCASGEVLQVHLSYFDKYNADAAKFVVDKVNAGGPKHY